MRVAILGGSFDPVHKAHIHMAKCAYQQLKVDEVWFLPANDAPLKDRPLSAYAHRVAMLERSIAPYSKFKINQIEASIQGKNYTIDTISLLKKQYPTYTFYFLMGADQVQQLDKWKDIKTLEKEVQLCAFVRDNKKIDTIYRIKELKMKACPVSSSKIREGNFTYVCEGVKKYIFKHRLYFTFIKQYMSEYRYEHSQRVATLAIQIAKANALNTEKAYLCGIFHDINKEFQWISLEDSKNIIRIMRPSLLQQKEDIWHGYMGRFILEHALDFHDKKILDAIENHVLGECRGIYAKLLYVADKLEPGRNYDTKPLIDACCKSLHVGYELVRKTQKEFYGEENKNGK